jgi:perosamine synthetase
MSRLDLSRIVAAVRGALPAAAGRVALHEPELRGNEWNYVKACLDSGMVSSIGAYVDEFERRLAALAGVPHAIATVNGTAALHVCLKLVGVGRDDEVLIPAMTFIATANAVAYCGAVPHFVDCEERTLGIDPVKLDAYLARIAVTEGGVCRNQTSGRAIKAVVPMHTFGHPVDLDPLLAVCRKYGLEMVEDAAESLGSYYKNRHTGAWGRVSALSFNGNKVVTTGGGGAILTNDKALAERAKHLTTTAKTPHAWAFVHDDVGYNYRLPNINAALGCAQLEQLPSMIERKRRLADTYRRAFDQVEGVRLFTEPTFARSNYWLNALILAPEHESARDELLALMHREQILARPVWTLMHHLPMYRDMPRADLSVAESLERRVVNIPSSPFLADVSAGEPGRTSPGAG